MWKRDILVIGGSVGAADVLRPILSALPADCSASVFIATHVPANGMKVLGPTLAGACALPLCYPQDGDEIAPGRVYVAPPDRHLLAMDRVIRLGLGPRENMARPAIDPLFRSAALAFGPRVIGVVLTGLLHDGASGLGAVKRCGGVTVVQDPHTARAPDMPKAAIAHTKVDHIVGAEQLPMALMDLLGAAVPGGRIRPNDLVLDVEIALGERLGGAPHLLDRGEPVAMTCPTCEGAMVEVPGATSLRFKCQAGHAFTGATLFTAQHDGVEQALWIALRVVEERVELVTRLAREAKTSGRLAVAEIYAQRALEYASYARTLRRAAIAMISASDVANDVASDIV